MSVHNAIKDVPILPMGWQNGGKAGKMILADSGVPLLSVSFIIVYLGESIL